MTVRTLGVLGLGEGRSVLSAAQSSAHWQVGLMCDLDPDRCRERADEFGLAAWTTDYADLLGDPGIDAIAIYTPDHLHLEHVLAALAAGKHVVCTKPLLDSLGGARRLLDAAERAPGRLLVGQSTRFFAPMINQRRDVVSGRHGEVVAVDCHYRADSRWFLERTWTRSPTFSWLWNFLSHAADLVRWYLPEVDEVTGFAGVSPTGRELGLQVPDTLRFVLRTPSGQVATVAGDYLTPTIDTLAEPSIGCLVRGTTGSSRADYPTLRHLTHYAGEGPRTDDLGAEHDYYFRFGGETHHAGEYQNYLDHLAACLDDGTNPQPGPHEAVRTLALLTAMERTAADGGRPVRVSDVLREHGLDDLDPVGR